MSKESRACWRMEFVGSLAVAVCAWLLSLPFDRRRGAFSG